MVQIDVLKFKAAELFESIEAPEHGKAPEVSFNRAPEPVGGQ